MQITEIVQQKSRYIIFLNDEPAFRLYRQEISELGLKKGDYLDENVYQMILTDILGKRAKIRSMKLLEGKDYTVKQLRMKLKDDGYPESVIQDAVNYVSSYHYLDDERYAVRYIEQSASTKSLRQIRMKLSEKGISSECIEKALEIADLPDQNEAIMYWLEKKKYSAETADEKAREKFAAFLMRRGFSYSEIKRVL